MATTILLGRPGSGKTTAARHFMQRAYEKDVPVVHIDDYEILQEKFRADTEHVRFHPLNQDRECSGFDVIDFRVLDEALKEAEARAKTYTEIIKNGLVIVEFARNDYQEALKLFHPDFLQEAYLLFFTIDIETSIQRVQQRYLKTGYHLVSDHILRGYYKDQELAATIAHLRSTYNLRKPVEICDNTGSWKDFFRQLNRFFDLLIEQESSIV